MSSSLERARLSVVQTNSLLPAGPFLSPPRVSWRASGKRGRHYANWSQRQSLFLSAFAAAQTVCGDGARGLCSAMQWRPVEGRQTVSSGRLLRLFCALPAALCTQMDSVWLLFAPPRDCSDRYLWSASAEIGRRELPEERRGQKRVSQQDGS